MLYSSDVGDELQETDISFPPFLPKSRMTVWHRFWKEILFLHLNVLLSTCGLQRSPIWASYPRSTGREAQKTVFSLVLRLLPKQGKPDFCHPAAP